MTLKEKLIGWWVTPKLPKKHYFIPPEKRPKGIYQAYRVYIRKWAIHPIKRRLAKLYLVFLRNFFGIKVIGITGSAGKTSTKDMLVSILRQNGKTVGSFANIDPIYNIPTSILSCSPRTKYLVLEMGVEFPGEMDFYLWLTRPDIGVITNIYPTHTEFFGDEVGVFKEKSKLAKGLYKGTTAVLNVEDKFLRKLKGHLKAKSVYFGKGGEIFSQREKLTKSFETEFLLVIGSPRPRKTWVKISRPGHQFVLNALAAASVGSALGIPIEQIREGLKRFVPQDHRMQIKRHRSGAIILDDSYNSNPEAAKEVLASLKIFPGEKVIVFGDMLELGKWERKYHIELGEYLGKMDISKLICVGKASRLTAEKASDKLGQDKVVSVSKWEEARTHLKPELKKGTFILVKGSRSIGLDKLVEKLS